MKIVAINNARAKTDHIESILFADWGGNPVSRRSKGDAIASFESGSASGTRQSQTRKGRAFSGQILRVCSRTYRRYAHRTNARPCPETAPAEWFNLIGFRSRAVTAAFGMVLLFANIPANAADTVYEEPPAPSAPEEVTPLAAWSGIYGGAVLGYGFGETDVGANNIDTDGFIGGIFGGAQYQSGSFVYGGETDIGYNMMDGTNAGVATEYGLEGSLRARIGYAATQDILLYGTGGVAVGRVEVTNAAGSDTNTVVGWTAGAGVDAKLTEQVFGRLEYRYTDYADKVFNPGGAAANVDANHSRLMLGLGLHF